MDNSIDTYKDLWGKDKYSYVLRPAEDGRYSIVNVENNSGLIIENDAIAHEVVRRMLAAGVLVGNPFDIQTRKHLIILRIQARKNGR